MEHVDEAAWEWFIYCEPRPCGPVEGEDDIDFQQQQQSDNGIEEAPSTRDVSNSDASLAEVFVDQQSDNPAPERRSGR